MLNLTLLKDGQELWGEAKPSWERKKPSTQKLEEIPIPDNQAELLSLQCRRILLHREGDIVVGYTEAAGEYIEKESAFVEQMTFWSLKKKGKDIEQFFPRLHDSSKQMWRDFSVLLGNSSRMPGVVSWVKKIQSKKLFPKTRFVKFRIVGVEYGSMNCGVVDEFSDSLEFHASILDDLSQKWQNIIMTEIERCNRLALIVGQLGRNLEKAIGGDGVSAEKRTKEQAYYRLDIPFRQWLLQIDPEQNLEKEKQYRMEWKKMSNTIIKNLGKELVDQVGSIAVAGRTVKEKINKIDVERHYSAPEAFNIFLHLLGQCDD